MIAIKENERLEVNEYQCPFCGVKRSFGNGLMFKRWIDSHECCIEIKE